MRFRRTSPWALPIMMILAADVIVAAEPKHPRHDAGTHVARKETEAARRERERREDLEQRVERLEQLYDLKEPATLPAEPNVSR